MFVYASCKEFKGLTIHVFVARLFGLLSRCVNKAFAVQAFDNAATYAYNEAAFSCGGGTHDYMAEFLKAGSVTVQVCKNSSFNCLAMTLSATYNDILGLLQVATSSETNLKFEVAVFGGTGSTVETFVPSDLAIARGTNNAYDSTPVILNSSIAPGLYLIRIQSVAQTANTAADGAAFPAYGSVVSTHLRGYGRTLSSCLHAIAVCCVYGPRASTL
jgi:hypothetical protein